MKRQATYYKKIFEKHIFAKDTYIGYVKTLKTQQ